MNFDVRGAVLHNIQDMNQQELRELVEDSIAQREEKYLPGLGVLFEVIWKHSEPDEQEQMLQTLQSQLKQK